MWPLGDHFTPNAQVNERSSCAICSPNFKSLEEPAPTSLGSTPLMKVEKTRHLPSVDVVARMICEKSERKKKGRLDRWKSQADKHYNFSITTNQWSNI